MWLTGSGRSKPWLVNSELSITTTTTHISGSFQFQYLTFLPVGALHLIMDPLTVQTLLRKKIVRNIDVDRGNRVRVAEVEGGLTIKSGTHVRAGVVQEKASRCASWVQTSVLVLGVISIVRNGDTTYIVQRKLPGVHLSDIINDLDETNSLRIVEKLRHILTQVSNITSLGKRVNSSLIWGNCRQKERMRLGRSLLEVWLDSRVDGRPVRMLSAIPMITFTSEGSLHYHRPYFEATEAWSHASRKC
ncbi:hypothetical protein DFS33DRAFT_658508 [Desarmillaria ectypa]|nr:hypothetical protein DFS33DRAFT_658508 [Desarmillaria ectypa]